MGMGVLRNVVATAVMTGSGCFAGSDSSEQGGALSTGAESAGGSGGLDDDDDDDNGLDGGDGVHRFDVGDPMIPPPEDETEANFRVPRASGRFVYTASEATNSVAIIDSSNLAIEVVSVGRQPTVVVPIDPGDAEGAVAVLNQGSDDVTLLRSYADRETTVAWREITPGANNLSVSPNGRFVFAHVDVDGPEEIGAGSDQEVSVIDITRDDVARMSVGAHPRSIVFSPEGDFAYVVTADGVNVVPIADGDFDGKPDVVPVYVEAGVDPANLEVYVAATHGIALARFEGDPRLVVTDLHLREQEVLTLPGIATDLDVSPDDAFATLVLPDLTGQSRLFELRLPLSDESALVEHLIPDQYVGLAQISDDGQTIILYTSQNPDLSFPDPPETGGSSGNEATTDDAQTASTGGESDASTSGESDASTGDASDASGFLETAERAPVTSDFDARLRVVIARRTSEGWDARQTLFVDRPLSGVGIAPDSLNAILLHAETTDASIPFAYTMVDLAKEVPVKKTQTVVVRPDPILFTPDGDRAVVLLRAPEGQEQQVEQVDLRTFIVEGLTLGSPPEGAGFVETTQKVFVSQEHATGRITFIDRDNAIQTVTGFRLNDAVKD